MALGGVLMGNIKSQLAERVTGMAKSTGEMPKSSASAPTMGTNSVTMAKLLMNAVRSKPTPESRIKYVSAGRLLKLFEGMGEHGQRAAFAKC